MKRFLVVLLVSLLLPTVAFAVKIKDVDIDPKHPKEGDQVLFTVKTDRNAARVEINFSAVPGPPVQMKPDKEGDKWQVKFKMNKPGNKEFSVTAYDKKGKKDKKASKFEVAQASQSQYQPQPQPSGQSEKQKVGSVYGKLHKNSVSGAALSGATVNCGGKTVTSDDNGNFRLDGIPTGNSTIQFSKSGYESFQAAVKVESGKTINVGDRFLSEVSNHNSNVSRPLDPQYKQVMLDLCEYNSDPQVHKYHRGVDIKAANGKNVYSISKGIVVDNHKANTDDHWNAALIVEYKLGNQKYYVYYAHITSHLTPKTEVMPGDKIGTVNLNHLHLSVNKELKYYWGYTAENKKESCEEIKKNGWLRFQDVLGLNDYSK